MKPSRPSIMNTGFFAGMYDIDEMIDWFTKSHYEPARCDRLIPLCVTRENCEAVLHSVAAQMGPQYVWCLQRFIEADPEQYVEAAKHSDFSQHYVLEGRVDPRYVEGLRVLKDYIQEHGFLDKQFDTSEFKQIYDPTQLLDRLETSRLPFRLAGRMIPLCMTTANRPDVLRMVDDRLGRPYVLELEVLARFVSWGGVEQSLEFERVRPSNRHYDLGDRVDPIYVEGMLALGGFKVANGPFDEKFSVDSHHK